MSSVKVNDSIKKTKTAFIEQNNLIWKLSAS